MRGGRLKPVHQLRSHNFEHSLEGDQRPLRRFFVDGNLIDDVTFGEVFETPAEMREVDTVHRRTHANDRRQKMDLLLWVLLLQSIDHVQFRTDRPL